MLLAVNAQGDTGLDVVVNLRPHIAASEFLRAHSTARRNVIMKPVQDIPLQAG